LTKHRDGKLIAVIVSGYDGDGAEALCGIKEVGGITIARKPQTTSRPDMPESTIATGCIDFILSPEDISVYDKKQQGACRLLQINKRDSRTVFTGRMMALSPVYERTTFYFLHCTACFSVS